MSTTNQPPAKVPAPWDQTLALFEQYPEDKFNRLLPTVTIADCIGELYRPKVEVVRIDPTLPVFDHGRLKEAGSGEVYQDKRMPDGTLAIARRGLQKFQHAGGLIMPPQINEVQEYRPGEYVIYKAGGAIKKADGSLLIVTKTKVVDLHTEEAKIRAQWTNKNEWRVKDNKTPWTDAEIEAYVQRDLLQVRENMVTNCETKAQNRVIRSIFALKDAYTLPELNKPFALIRFDQAFDLDNPTHAAMILQQANVASGQLFGTPVLAAPTTEARPATGAEVKQETPSGAEVDEAPEEDDLDRPPDEPGVDEKAIAEIEALDYETIKKRWKKALDSIAFEDQGEREVLMNDWRLVHKVEGENDGATHALHFHAWAAQCYEIERRAGAK